MRIMLILAMIFFISGCARFDDNAKPEYGKESGLPVNCRAYTQVAIDGYRQGIYTANDALIGLERNCGLAGKLWKENR